MSVLNINVINKSENPLPEYATEGSSGMDLRANNETALILKPLERVLVPTGLFLEIPLGFEAQIRPRSGLAVKKGLTCLNTPGTIDSDYRGEIKVLLINLSNEEQVINLGERIAQMVFVKVDIAQLTLVHQLNDTVRAAGGFGHTGIQ
ncbi:MAG: dUTP diphosphatase [Ferruginibacter sp.]